MMADGTGGSESLLAKTMPQQPPGCQAGWLFFSTPTDVGFEKLTIFVIQGKDVSSSLKDPVGPTKTVFTFRLLSSDSPQRP